MGTTYTGCVWPDNDQMGRGAAARTDPAAQQRPDHERYIITAMCRRLRFRLLPRHHRLHPHPYRLHRRALRRCLAHVPPRGHGKEVSSTMRHPSGASMPWWRRGGAGCLATNQFGVNGGETIRTIKDWHYCSYSPPPPPDQAWFTHWGLAVKADTTILGQPFTSFRFRLRLGTFLLIHYDAIMLDITDTGALQLQVTIVRGSEGEATADTNRINSKTSAELETAIRLNTGAILYEAEATTGPAGLLLRHTASLPPPPSPPPPAPSPASPPLFPCIGEAASFDFFVGDLAFNNLGGVGPDPQGIRPALRYVNVGWLRFAGWMHQCASISR